MSITLEKRQAYSEVLEYIYLLDKEYIDRIPVKFLQFLERNKDDTYFRNINPWEPIENQKLKQDTMILLSYINMKYWSSEEEQEKLKKIYTENEKKYQEECAKKYNPNDIFKKHEVERKNNENERLSNLQSQEYMNSNMLIDTKSKKSFFIFKIIDKIKKWLNSIK